MTVKEFKRMLDQYKEDERILFTVFDGYGNEIRNIDFFQISNCKKAKKVFIELEQEEIKEDY